MLRLKINHKTYVLRTPTPDESYLAEEIYQSVYDESLADGLFSEAEFLEFLADYRIWGEAEENRLALVTKDIEEFKVQLFELSFRSIEKSKTQAKLAVAKKELLRLYNLRHAYDYTTCEGAAASARIRYLIGTSLRTHANKKVSWRTHSNIIEQAIELYYKNMITEAEYREIVRNEPFNSMWNASRTEGSLFGKPANQMGFLI
jgi:hypothetical protein